MLKFEPIQQYIPNCQDYVSNEKGEKQYIFDGFVIRCEKRMICANSGQCQMIENNKKVEEK